MVERLLRGTASRKPSGSMHSVARFDARMAEQARHHKELEENS